MQLGAITRKNQIDAAYLQSNSSLTFSDRLLTIKLSQPKRKLKLHKKQYKY